VSAETVVERAERLGTPQVILTNGELLRILAGHPLVCGGLDGNEYVVRLATADEFMAVNRVSVDKRRPGGPYATRAQAENLTQPYDLGAYDLRAYS
jgi:hypothetical protein